MRRQERGPHEESETADRNREKMNSNQNLMIPNIILAGAPKCGTTSVFDYLRDHPQICASNVKETYYLMDPDYPLAREYSYHMHGFDGYREYFSHCSATTGKKRLEATPDYLYQNTPLRAFENWPDEIPVIIFVLRKPEDRIYSLYKFATGNMARMDKRLTFSEFVQRIDRGEMSKQRRVVLENAIEHSKYINYLRNWASVVGKDKIAVFLFEDLVENPASLMERICEFLEIDGLFYRDYRFAPSNKSYEVRSQSMHKIKQKISSMIPKNRLRSEMAKLYEKFNVMEKSGVSESDRRVMLMLHDRLRPSMAELSREFGVDLSKWYGSGQGADSGAGNG